MPASVTHAYFAKDVYDVLPKEIKSNLSVDRCRMFGQSTDAFMFYNLFSLFPGKKIRKFQYYFHTNHTQSFFIHLLEYMRDNDIHDQDTYSFLVGFICHYVLDSTLHPFVVYKTGYMEKGKPSTYQYNNMHAFMETFIDNDMIRRREKTNPYQFDIGKFCFQLKPFSNELNQAIRYSFLSTFEMDHMDKIYFKSLKQMKNALLFFRKDRYGIKKFGYKMVDKITPKWTYRFEAISYHYPLEDKNNYLNSSHKLWRNPIQYNLTSNESFLDLYLKAIRKAKVIVCASFDYLDGKEIDLEQIFPNISYVTGLDCNNHKELKYFEF